MMALLLQFGPWALGLLGVLFGFVRHQQAGKTAAQAQQQVAEAKTQVVQQQVAIAEANTQAARTGAEHQDARRNEDDNTTALQPGDAERLLRDNWNR